MTPEVNKMPEDADLRSRVVLLEQHRIDHHARLTYVERKQTEGEVNDARRDEQFTAVTRRLDNIDKNTTWIVRLVIGGIALAFIAFMTGGGLHIPK